MSLNPSSVDSLRRVFQQGFLVHDIAEPLISFDEMTDSGYIKHFMIEHNYEIIGVRSEGSVKGYLQLADIRDGQCGDHMKPFEQDTVILDSTSLADLIIRLRDNQRLFVSIMGKVGGIVSRTDILKPPVRMWLFGMVTLIEMRFNRLIEQFSTNDDWKAFLSEGRIKKAEVLLEERLRRNQDLSLLDCLQMADKAQIVARNKELRKLTRFESRRQLEDAAKKLEKLRNNLAHSQDIILNDWETILELSVKLDDILEGPPGLKEVEF